MRSLRWSIPMVGEGAAAQLAARMRLHPLAAQVLVARGLATPELAEAFLQDKLSELPDPFLLKGMAEAVEVLVSALRQKKRIVLYGDYDVDGVCSTALLSLFLEEVGGQVTTYIPHRIGEGYGLNLQAVERLAADGAQVLVTLDCGITSAVEVARANALGLAVVVVDHHTVPDELPPAAAVLNPHQPGCHYPTRHLCAAGVAFNLCIGLRKRLRELGAFAQAPEPNLKSLLDLVALATVADVVPLTGANRIMVKHGLAELSSARRPGIRALKEVAGLGPDEEVTAGQVGFRLGPRINAAGRLDDASVGLRLLRSSRDDESAALARSLDTANSERQAIEAEILQQALRQAELRAEARGLVLHSEGWHPGVVGIVASRVVERFHRPTVVVAVKDGVGRGSGRSIEKFHLFEALEACAPHLSRYGGHRHAAGISIEASRLAEFAEAFERIAAQRLSEEDLVPGCRVDAVVGLGELSEEAVNAVQALGPFGAGHPEPVFATRRLAAQGRSLAHKQAGQVGHLKLSLEAAPQLSAIGFGMADRLGLTEGPVDLAYQVSIDRWNGVRRIQLKLKDLKISA